MARVILAEVVDVMARPWSWGEADCCASAYEVFRRLHGVDPMAALRGTYSSRRSANRIIRSFGGFEAMTARLAAGAGLREGLGEPGEVGSSVAADRWSLVICVSAGQWAGKTVTGFRTIPAVERSWRV